ncbi:MAG TPA: class I SAM-dependent methyltransferase [Solirubrobacteraceae bacterium]|nr:class I SAM-dependent methyltransferase [Solirubrobacteraceae bacterium]
MSRAYGGVQITKRTWRPPPAVGWALRRTRELADLPRRAAILPGAAALPPRRLRARAGAAGGYAFAEGGRQAAAELGGLIRAVGRDPADLRSVLDFGCGSGRVLPHMAALAPQAAYTGCDVDAAAIDWAARAHRALGWSLNSFHPPLPFADCHFDLVYAISVFSHLDRGLASMWLSELRRVLAPDGLALLSVHGPHAFEQFRTGAVTTSWCSPATFRRGPLGPGEFVFAPYHRSFWTDGDLPGVGREYGLAFQGPEHTRASWGSTLQVVEVRAKALTDWQDVAVCVNC